MNEATPGVRLNADKLRLQHENFLVSRIVQLEAKPLTVSVNLEIARLTARLHRLWFDEIEATKARKQAEAQDA